MPCSAVTETQIEWLLDSVCTTAWLGWLLTVTRSCTYSGDLTHMSHWTHETSHSGCRTSTADDIIGTMSTSSWLASSEIVANLQDFVCMRHNRSNRMCNQPVSICQLYHVAGVQSALVGCRVSCCCVSSCRQLPAGSHLFSARG